MSDNGSCPFHIARRGFLSLAGGLMAAAGTGFGARAAVDPAAGPTAVADTHRAVEAFWGKHQGGIVTPAQTHSYFAAFDLATTKRDDVINLLKTWTSAAARMTSGQLSEPSLQAKDGTALDSGEAMDLPPARLTLTFGFGPGLFIKDGNDRYGLARQRPEAFVDMPKFVGDQLVADHTGGDLSVQACTDDPQVAFHAVRQLARLAYDVAQIRWTQVGFLPNARKDETPRNLMGFKDGTANPSVGDAKTMDKVIWIGNEGPDWMRGGSYMVARRIRIALEHWDRMKVAFQEQTIGRQKKSGASLGMKREADPLALEALDGEGNPVIPENAHVRLAAPASNDGATILRRGYSYNDGVNFTAERWPPWRQGMEYDAGLFFVCYQSDLRTGFIKIFDKMSKFDMMNQFVTHVGGGFFACPGGAAKGEFIGQGLFSAT